MAGGTKRIDEYPSVSNATGNDFLLAMQAGVTVKETVQQIANAIQSNYVVHYAGDPNGNVAGTIDTLCWDTVLNQIWRCSVSGTAATAVWINSQTGLVQPIDGGTGVVSPTPNTLPIAKGALPFDFVPLNDGEILIGKTGDAPTAATITAGDYIVVNGGANSLQVGVTGVFDVPHGGSGLATVPAHNVLLGNGVANFVTAAPSSDTTYALMSNGLSANPSFKNISGKFLKYTCYTSGTTHNPTAGANFAFVKVVAGGSSGAGTGGAGNTAASGGGGATVYGIVPNVFGVPVNIIIGAGGASVAANVNAAGNIGGNSFFGVLAVAQGASAPTGGVGGLGGVGGAAGSCIIPAGGNAVDGGTGSNGNGGSVNRAHAGNTTMGVTTAPVAGSAGVANTGNGGTGGTNALPSGAGASGRVEVWEFS